MNKWKIAFFATFGLLVVNNVGAWIGMRSYEEAGKIYRDTIDKLLEPGLSAETKEEIWLANEDYKLNKE